jgi:hypothetical protein
MVASRQVAAWALDDSSQLQGLWCCLLYRAQPRRSQIITVTALMRGTTAGISDCTTAAR